MNRAPEPLPPSLVALQRLVLALLAVMVVGFAVLIAAFVWRLNAGGVSLPEALDAPEGTDPVAVTMGPDWVAVVTADDRILVFDRLTGALREEVGLD